MNEFFGIPPSAEFLWIYDGNGNINRSIDIHAKKEYNYEYEEGRIIRAAESDITLNGELVVGRTLLNTVRYYYDAEGQLTKKVITPAGKSSFAYTYTNTDNATTVQFTAGGRTVTCQSNTDHLGRKTFDELQLGTGAISRQFSYLAGEVTEEHIANGKQKSSATTQLVSRIVLSDGRTLSYEYDAEERITKVIDSVEGTTLYTYDVLGQLLTETKNGVVVNTMTYDNYGNIKTKNGILYTYDATWKDLLTSYDGKLISYDAQGNPTSYLGHTLTWEKGRQLKSFDSNTYTYNANGIRTSKTVNAVTHTYNLDGTKILRETWGSNTLVPLYDNEDCVCGIIYNNTPYYFLKNLQGDIIAITDATGTAVAEYSYDAWGKCTIICDCCGIASINPFRYRGYYYDEETELYYLQSRYYNPIVGRFLNLDDPELLPSKSGAVFVNLFNYCNNNVICFDDSTGHTLIQDVLSIINKAIDALANLLKQYTVGTKQYKKLKDKLKNLKVNKRANKSQIKQVRKRMDESCSNTRLFGSKFAKIAKVLSVLGIVITCLGDALSYNLDMIYILSMLAVDALCELISWLLSKGGEILGKLVPGVGFILGWTLGWCIGLIVSAIFTDKMKENTAYDCYDDWRWNDKLSFSNRIKSLFGTFWNGVWNYGIKAVF